MARAFLVFSESIKAPRLFSALSTKTSFHKLQTRNLHGTFCRGSKGEQNIHNSWTTEEVELLHDLMRSGKSKKEVLAAFPSRPPRSIQSKWCIIGPRDSRGRLIYSFAHPYTQDEVRKLKMLHKAGITSHSELLPRFQGRTAPALRTKMQSLLHSDVQRFKYFWTPQDTQRLVYLREALGFSWRDIASEFGRTVESVRKRYRKVVDARKT